MEAGNKTNTKKMTRKINISLILKVKFFVAFVV
jgi:hypothetical protein